MTTAAAPETQPIGQAGNMRQASYLLAGRQAVTRESDPAEQNPALHFPQSVAVFDEMAKTDGQVGSLLRAVVQSIRRAAWDFHTDGVRSEVVDRVRTEIGLPSEGEALPRRRAGSVVFSDHLREALTCLTHGFSAFEPLYAVEIPPDGTRPVVHLMEIGARPQRSLLHLLTDPSGNLETVVQRGLPTAQYPTGYIPIPAANLVFYCHEREGADWAGNSLLRSAYKHWLIKDQMLRLSAQIVERNGMGVPSYTYDPNLITPEQVSALGAQWRAGATAHQVLPLGVTMTLQGVNGSLVDPLPTIKYHDQAIAESALGNFLKLGHDNGARSLGETFQNLFNNSLQATADFVAQVFTERVVRVLVEANFGPDEPYPVLTPGDMTANDPVTAADLASLVSAKLLTADDPTEEYLRKIKGLPKSDPASARGDTPVAPATADGPAYDGVDPNAPIPDRVNQPIPLSSEQRYGLIEEDVATAAAATLARLQVLAGHRASA